MALSSHWPCCQQWYPVKPNLRTHMPQREKNIKSYCCDGKGKINHHSDRKIALISVTIWSVNRNAKNRQVFGYFSRSSKNHVPGHKMEWRNDWLHFIIAGVVGGSTIGGVWLRSPLRDGTWIDWLSGALTNLELWIRLVHVITWLSWTTKLGGKVQIHCEKLTGLAQPVFWLVTTRTGWGAGAGADRCGAVAAATRGLSPVTDAKLESPTIDVVTEVKVIAFCCEWRTPLASYALYLIAGPVRRLQSRVTQPSAGKSAVRAPSKGLLTEDWERFSIPLPVTARRWGASWEL